jgi:tRNA dimethylallyltransferase
MKKIIIICGPTAGGKTNYAFELARKNNGVIINADSRQLFKDIQIISASPEKYMKEAVPHYLYNFLDSKDSYNVANYISHVDSALKNIEEEHIYIVGGTGMYIDALINGIAEIPEIPEEARREIRNYHVEVGNDVIYQELKILDPENKLNPNDTQRILRAYEVVKYTNKNLKFWQEHSKQKPILQHYEMNVIIPERNILYDNCNKRFLQMLDAGGIEEVEALQNPSPQILNTIGISQISHYLTSKISFNEMVSDTQAKTRQYAKRQVTWFRRYGLNK